MRLPLTVMTGRRIEAELGPAASPAGASIG
jgi:hypothetical protein